MPTDLLLYGAYGYTGSLVAEAAAERGLDVTLAGRDSSKLRPIAEDLGYEAVVFRLDERAAVRAALENHAVVLNCAGPFVDTAEPLVDAAIETGTDYLDVTGEIGVFEWIHDRGGAAREAGVTLLPGVGFDVVPTDCLAAHLADRLPGAETLALAFESEGPASRGTTRTSLRHLHEGGRVRRAGEIRRVPLASDVREVDFGDGPRTVAAIPWGDVATAYHSTGIPNVTVYTSMSPGRVRRLRRLRHLAPALSLGAVRWLLLKLASGDAGPDAATRERTGARLWGRATAGETPQGESVQGESARGENERGETEMGTKEAPEAVVSRLRTPNTYDFTVESALEATCRVLDGEAAAGFQTPATAFGPEFVLSLPGVEGFEDDPVAAPAEPLANSQS